MLSKINFFSCHEICHKILSNMVKMNHKELSERKKHIKSEYHYPKFLFCLWSSLIKKAESGNQKAVSKNKKCLENNKFKLAIISAPRHLFFLIGKYFSKEVEDKYFLSILLENDFPER